ncbi:nephrin-like isoform X2 [Tigriopus californicus]|uniref:nephrin-like isoform X2 n=1 Tax=Tigriopus californicus TaxID=6832 RepID=UPI0027D9F809|nr:nephrin-like isoform X2 [Tigriopus californicus]
MTIVVKCRGGQVWPYFPLILGFILYSGVVVEARQQHFRVRPHDVEVASGGTAVITCEVGNRAGRVQWTKDGLTLGYQRSIPGIPRYQVLGSDDSGEFSLQISGVSLDDDADYECQVGPGNFNAPIRASAHLYVLLPPTSIQIEGYNPGQRVDIKETEECELTCIVADAKPKATIMWFRNDLQFTPESTEDTDEDGTKEGRKTVKSKIKFHPTPRDNGAKYYCQAAHPALGGTPMKSWITMSVQFPPGPPEIQGYLQGETIRLGQAVTLTCVSHGGNPLAEIVWYKNGDGIDFSYTTAGRESRNTYNFIAATDDNNAKYRCEAKNFMSTEPMVTEISLAVQFAPDKVTITGPTEAKAGDELNFECETGNSNPPASIQWLVDGVRAHENFTHKATSPNGGWVSKSDLSTKVGPEDRNIMISCYAVNQALGETIVETHMVSVLYPPGKPNITGLVYGDILEEGQMKRLTCISMAGNPLADLTWFRGEEKIEGTTTIKGGDGKYSSSELAIIANRTDNELPYRCEASNPATSEPKKTTVQLSVLFKPALVKITVDPASPKAGKKAILTCESSSSNPTASIVWRYNGKRMSGSDQVIKTGEYGGNVTSNLLEIDVTPEHQGAVFICEAKNPVLDHSVHDAETLSVKYKPQFPDDVEGAPLKVFTVEEGASILIDLTAEGNPAKIDYKWTTPDRDNIPNQSEALPESRLIVNGGTLNISAAKRVDAGKYKVKGSNDEGKTTFKFKLDVFYEPSITEITDAVVVKPGDNAEFSCFVDANPIKDDTIQWKREDFDMTRVTTTNISNIVYLTVKNVTDKDSGKFDCVANNGIGAEVKNSSFLLVRHKPMIDESPGIAKSASDKGLTGVLTCRATGVPKVKFIWSREGSVIDPTSDNKYAAEESPVDMMTFESLLSVKNVTSLDYGAYDCIAQNEEGLDRHTIYLNVTSRPDAPAFLRVLNVTYTSVTLNWTPGFDGGFVQSFRIRFRKADSNVYHYVDVSPPGTDTFEVQDLKVGTTYRFAIMSHNYVGESEYTADIGEVTTKSAIPITHRDDKIERTISRGIIITITLVAGALLFLNVILISCYVRRKKSRKRGGGGGGGGGGGVGGVGHASNGGSTTGSSKSATIEMYVGSSYGTDALGSHAGDNMSSSMSDKSGSYSSNNDQDHSSHHHHSHPHHIYHPHQHHLLGRHQPPSLEVPIERDEELDPEEDDTFEVEEGGPIRPPPPSKSSFYALKRDPRATTNYATMPRRPSNQSSGVESSNGGRHHGGSFFHSHQHSATLTRPRHRDEFHRQAYVQSIETSHDIYVPSVTSVQSSAVSFPPPPSSLGSLTRGLRGVSKGPPVPPLPSSYEGDYNGLYVPPADEDPYTYVPPPRPPMPSEYPEDEGHLV